MLFAQRALEHLAVRVVPLPGGRGVGGIFVQPTAPRHVNYPNRDDARLPGPEERARLFVALWPTGPLRARLVRERDSWEWPATVRPVADASLHLTLHFIGAFARRRIAALEGALAALPAAPVELRPAAREIWPGGIAVLRLSASPRLSSLHEEIGGVLDRLGVTLDPRPFAPHVTLARRARGATLPDAPAGFVWRARGFALVESLARPGAGYRVLRTFGDALRRP